MKLNAAVEMIPISWPHFSSLHPYIPADQAYGYKMMMDECKEYFKVLPCELKSVALAVVQNMHRSKFMTFS